MEKKAESFSNISNENSFSECATQRLEAVKKLVNLNDIFWLQSSFVHACENGLARDALCAVESSSNAKNSLNSPTSAVNNPYMRRTSASGSCCTN